MEEIFKKLSERIEKFKKQGFISIDERIELSEEIFRFSDEVSELNSKILELLDILTTIEDPAPPQDPNPVIKQLGGLSVGEKIAEKKREERIKKEEARITREEKEAKKKQSKKTSKKKSKKKK